jgi:PAS domain S-box-containing protein
MEKIFHSSTDLVLITNSKGIIIEANPKAFDFFSGQKFIGRLCGELLSLPSTSLKAIYQTFPPERAHEITVSTTGGHFVFEMRILQMETGARPAGRAMVLLKDRKAMVKQRVPLESRLTEGSLAKASSEKILSAIFMSVGEGILLVDEDLEIVKANRRAVEIYGVPEQNLVSMDIRLLTDSSGAQVLVKFFDELIEGQRLSAEIPGLYVDGKTFPATVTVTRSDFDGKRYWPIIVRDNTDQRTLEKQLRLEKQQTEDMNLTLKTVMKSIEQDRKDVENRVTSKIRTSLLPTLNKIDKASEAGVRKSYLALLKEQLLSLTAGFEGQLDAGLLRLTKTEIEVCRLIKAGCSSKDICDTMKLSFETIQTHRKNIRRKLDLSGKKLNLYAFLMNRVL